MRPTDIVDIAITLISALLASIHSLITTRKTVGWRKLVWWLKTKGTTFLRRINGAAQWVSSPTRAVFFLRLTLIGLTVTAWGVMLAGWLTAWSWGLVAGSLLTVVILLTTISIA